MAVQQNNRKDSLTIFRNNMMLDIAITEVNLKLAEKERFATITLNPNLSGQLAGLKEKIAHIQNSIYIVDKMIEEEAKDIN